MRCQFDLWVEKIPWGRKWQLTPVFLPGESHGQKSLAGYNLWGSKKSDSTVPEMQQREKKGLHRAYILVMHAGSCCCSSLRGEGVKDRVQDSQRNSET